MYAEEQHILKYKYMYIILMLYNVSYNLCSNI